MLQLGVPAERTGSELLGRARALPAQPGDKALRHPVEDQRSLPSHHRGHLHHPDVHRAPRY